MNHSELKKAFMNNKWYLTKNQLNKIGINDYYIRKLIEKGRIIKIKNGLYKYKNADLGGYDDFFDISKIEPKGVFCLYTAMNFYDLTSFISSHYYFAIPRKYRIKKGFENYPVKIKKWQGNYFELGIVLFKLGKLPIRIYDLEKTVCDSIRYRNEIGLNTLKEVLTTYFQSKQKNISKLTKYAEILGVGKILREFTGMII